MRSNWKKSATRTSDWIKTYDVGSSDEVETNNPFEQDFKLNSRMQVITIGFYRQLATDKFLLRFPHLVQSNSEKLVIVIWVLLGVIATFALPQKHQVHARTWDHRVTCHPRACFFLERKIWPLLQSILNSVHSGHPPYTIGLATPHFTYTEGMKGRDVALQV